jgi:uncharacterized SAM-binding protein YcdF (DUF218 family)
MGKSEERGGVVASLIALLFVAMLCAVVYFARRPILRYAAESWIVDEPAAHADAIIVLGDDNYFGDRATRATELFRQGVAPVVVASGRKLRPSAGVAELMEHDLSERGVPKDKLIRIDQDTDTTREQAGTLGRFAETRGWKSVVVVTSNYDSRRALYICRRVFPGGILVSVASAADGDFDPQKWWESRKSTKAFVSDTAGMVVAMWELRNSR